MRYLLIAVSALWLAAPIAAQAGIVITVDKTAQSLTVEVDGATRYQWPVSTARWGYRTPNGTYRPQRLERQWFSRKYDWSPMPNSIFFSGGYAIHGSYEVSRLGRPASHGCIRLHPQNAATLFELVQRRTADTRIVVVGGGEELMARHDASRRHVESATRPPRDVARGHATYESRRTYRSVQAQNHRSFEEVFDQPPRYRVLRTAPPRWDD